MHQFSKTSLKILETCHKDIQTVMLYGIMTSPIDFGISRGHSSPEEQFELFKKGRKKNASGIWEVVNPTAIVTNLDGFIKLSKHNRTPSEAVDIFAWVPGKRELMYDEMHLAFLGGHLLKCSKELLAKGKISHPIRWGGNWDGDGELIYDQKLWDKPHYEIIK